MKTYYKKIDLTAAKLMFYGSKLALGVLVIGICAYYYNEKILMGGYNCYQICIGIISAAVSLFVQFIVGGLIFDCVSKGRK